MYPSKHLPSNPTSAAGGGKFSAVGVIFCIFLTVTIFISSSSWNYETSKLKNQTRKQATPLPVPKPHPVQSLKEIQVKSVKGKGIIIPHSVMSFGRKWGTAMQRGLFSLHRPDGHHGQRNALVRKKLRDSLLSSGLQTEGRKGEWEGV